VREISKEKGIERVISKRVGSRKGNSIKERDGEEKFPKRKRCRSKK
jgi:hypothetical protein